MSFLSYLTCGEPAPLVYPEITKENQFTNVLLIDNSVNDYQTFVESVNSSTFPIVYSIMSNKTELLTLLQANFTSISRIGIVFSSSLGNVKMFLDGKSFFNEEEVEPYSENVEFILNVLKEFRVKNIDYLACDTLNYSNWENYYQILSKETAVIVGASNDKTGNIKHGGDWIMESTSQDVELLYFTKRIEYYQYLLDNPVLLQNFRVDYSDGVYVLLTIDVNNFYPGSYTIPPSWLDSFQLYYSGSLQYTLPDLNGLVFQSYTSYPFNDPNNLQSAPGIAFWTSDNNITPNAYYNSMIIKSLGLNMFISSVSFNNPPIVCFKEGSKILTDQGYKLIQNLRKGDLVKTLLHNYLPIDLIGKREIHHLALKERIKDQLYQCSQDHFEEVFEPLVITGCHSILVDDFVSEEQREKVIEVNGNTYVTDRKYRLPACADPRASIYEIPGNYTIYHLALENDDYYMNYGIYANGLLVETCSKRYLKELSNMELIE